MTKCKICGIEVHIEDDGWKHSEYIPNLKHYALSDDPILGNHGQPWNSSEVEQLKEECLKGLKIDEIARIHKRTEKSIKHKMVGNNLEIIEKPIKNKRKQISKSVKDTLWKKIHGDLGIAECPCKKIIRMSDFEAGHIKAAANGGTNDISNLYPICSTCNKSMRDQNLIEFFWENNKVKVNPEAVFNKKENLKIQQDKKIIIKKYINKKLSSNVSNGFFTKNPL